MLYDYHLVDMQPAIETVVFEHSGIKTAKAVNEEEEYIKKHAIHVSKSGAYLMRPGIMIPEYPLASADIDADLVKLTKGSEEDKAETLQKIINLCNNKSPEALQYLDSRYTDAVIAIISTDTSSLKGPDKKVLKCRKKYSEGKELSKNEKEILFRLSPRELAVKNQTYGLCVLGSLQRLVYREDKKRTGITPSFDALPSGQKLINYALNDKNANIRSGAIGALSMIARPEYKDILIPVFKKALNDSAPEVREFAQKALINYKRILQKK